MQWFLEWRIKRLKIKIERLGTKERALSLSDCFPVTLAKYKAELKLKDLQAEHDIWYGNKYNIVMVKRGCKNA